MDIESHPRYVPLTDQPKQGSDAWFALREGVCTGSRPSSLYFDLTSPEKWKECHEKIFGKRKEVFDERALAAMAWGSKHEDSAVEVILNTFPNAIFEETPFLAHKNYDFLAASPDGRIIVKEDDGTEWTANVEIKCVGTNCLIQTKQFQDYRAAQKALENNPNDPVCQFDAEQQALKWQEYCDTKGYPDMAKYLRKKKGPPAYYMGQIAMEMCVQREEKTLFVMWTPLLCKMHLLDFDHAYYTQTVDYIDAFRKQLVPWHVMDAKHRAWKRTSWVVANKATLLHELQLNKQIKF